MKPLSDPAASARSVGRVVGLRAYPVKSMDADEVPDARVLTGGLEHDRRWAVVDADGAIVTARTAPVLRQVRVGMLHPDGPDLLLPGAELPVRSTSGNAALSSLVGRPVSLRPATGDGPGFTESAAVHLVSRQAIAAATVKVGAVEEGAAPADPPCSVDDPRANIVIDLDAPAETLETDWAGRQVQLGEVLLLVDREPRHCLGVYAVVLAPGSVSVGDPVMLWDPVILRDDVRAE